MPVPVAVAVARTVLPVILLTELSVTPAVTGHADVVAVTVLLGADRVPSLSASTVKV